MYIHYTVLNRYTVYSTIEFEMSIILKFVQFNFFFFFLVNIGCFQHKFLKKKIFNKKFVLSEQMIGILKPGI